MLIASCGCVVLPRSQLLVIASGTFFFNLLGTRTLVSVPDPISPRAYYCAIAEKWVWSTAYTVFVLSPTEVGAH